MATIWQQAEELKDEMVERRRDLHRHPETGWTEFRTASMIIGELKKLGYDVKFGADVIDEKSMMGVPSEAELADYMQRAISEGANPELVKKMAAARPVSWQLLKQINRVKQLPSALIWTATM